MLLNGILNKNILKSKINHPGFQWCGARKEKKAEKQNAESRVEGREKTREEIERRAWSVFLEERKERREM